MPARPSAKRNPPVCVSTWRTVTASLPFAANSGMYSQTRSSMSILPCSQSWPIATAALGFVEDHQIIIESLSIATPGRDSPRPKSATALPSRETYTCAPICSFSSIPCSRTAMVRGSASCGPFMTCSFRRGAYLERRASSHIDLLTSACSSNATRLPLRKASKSSLYLKMQPSVSSTVSGSSSSRCSAISAAPQSSVSAMPGFL